MNQQTSKLAGPSHIQQAASALRRAEIWDKPIGLEDLPVPALPLDAFPEHLAIFVRAEAEATQTPVAMAAMLALGAIAAALAKKFVVEAEVGWIEPLNLFIAVAMPPASRKSAVCSDIVSPLRDYEMAEAARLAPACEESKHRILAIEGRLRKIQEKGLPKGGASDLNIEIRELHALLAAEKKIRIPRLLADDVTSEKLGILLHQNHGRMAIITAEGGNLFALMGGRYNGGSPNFDLYLKAHAGDSTYTDRVGRESLALHQPAVTLALTIQPDLLRSLSSVGNARGQGLLARFLFCVPATTVGNRRINPDPVPPEAREAYVKCMTALATHPLVLDDDGAAVPRKVTPSPAARDRLREFRTELEPRLGPDGDLHHVADWAGKLPGAIARLAALLTLAGPDGPNALEIGEQTMKGAIALARSLVPHALLAFQKMEQNPAATGANRILTWIRRHEHTHFTRGQAYNDLRRGLFAKASDLDAALSVLKCHNYIQQVESSHSRVGRPVEMAFAVSPLVRPLASTENRCAVGHGNYSDYSDGFRGVDGEQHHQSGGVPDEM